MTAKTGRATLQPGDWTPTGWGAQHRVRRSDEKWTELVCHTVFGAHGPGVAGESNRVSTGRIDRDADEAGRCSRCASLPDLGPLRYGPLGEVRRSPDGLLAVCHREAPGNGLRWKVIGEEPIPGCHGWRDDWNVAAWVVVGNVYALPGGDPR